MTISLPATTDEQVAQFQAEYSAAFGGSNQEELESAKCRLIWALAHHTASRAHLQRGLDLAEAALGGDARTADQDRELKYLSAVAMYNLRSYIAARRALADLLADYPDFRQAQALYDEVNELVIRDGLLGLGMVASVVGLGVGLLAAAGRRR
ncbi:hypothetical protein Rsub_07785 [Raphidocelis subcapitata]|uniref:Mitochondrial fission 1 protein n=1 Tax=Raphidocelis subcapitata TaxID=307507 RepID=A0A2V0PDW1_9CHLO|nr:hypothetical protein Rsub_07785 [Raphidocelis subcapitata]|eukprot:GBF95357.1 hypothetical protein Rsub_07785 [Raphidocelis subcapitata]